MRKKGGRSWSIDAGKQQTCSLTWLFSSSLIFSSLRKHSRHGMSAPDTPPAHPLNPSCFRRPTIPSCDFVSVSALILKAFYVLLGSIGPLVTTSKGLANLSHTGVVGNGLCIQSFQNGNNTSHLYYLSTTSASYYVYTALLNIRSLNTYAKLGSIARI